MPLLEEKVYTIDDIYALPEGERAELIDGHIYYTAPPNRTHQKISRINWMIKAAMVHQTGLLRLFLLQVNEWTIIRSFLNTEQQV